MKIGIILYWINPNYKGGVTSYTLSLLKGFKNTDKNNSYTLFVSKKNKYIFEKFEGQNFTIKEIALHKGKGTYLALKNKLSRIIVNYFSILPVIRIFFSRIYKLAFCYLISLINNSDIDVVYCPHELPIYFKKPTVVSIHDIQHVHFPEFFDLGKRLHREVFYKETVRGATVVQTSSNYIRQDFIKYFHLQPEKVITVRDGINNIFKRKIDQIELINVKNKYKLPNDFIFYPSQHWRHKNHLNLMKAVSYLRKKHSLKMPLVFTGEVNRRFQFFYDAINKSDLKEDIKLLGNVPLKDLSCLYKLATVMAMPSLHESNSLPVMEALAVGCPVAASNIEPNIELNINSAITIFDRNDYKDIAKKIQQLWENNTLREKKIKLGQELAEKSSWGKTANDYILIFKKILKC